jgi:hypothetical protein
MEYVEKSIYGFLSYALLCINVTEHWKCLATFGEISHIEFLTKFVKLFTGYVDVSICSLV